MRKICLILVCLLALPFVLTSCGSDTPDGHMLVSDPEKDGFSLYIPEEWNYNASSGVLTAYPSSLSSANLTVAYLESEEATIAEYWAAQEVILKGDFPDFALVENYPTLENVAGRSAYVYEYTATYIAVKYHIRQYLIPLGTSPSEGMYVVTYTASSEQSAYTGSVDFESSLEQVKTLMGYFAITGKPGGETLDMAVADENAPEGMKRANLVAYLGMDVYVPTAWQVYLSDGFIAAETGDGKGNVSISNIDFTGSAAGANSLMNRFDHYGITLVDERGVTLIDYWNLLKAEYSEYFDNFTVLSEPDLNVGEEEQKTPPIVAGESSYYAFTFTGEKYGQTYCITQYMFRETSSRTGLFRALTYTTIGAENHIHGEEIVKVISEVKY